MKGKYHFSSNVLSVEPLENCRKRHQKRRSKDNRLKGVRGKGKHRTQYFSGCQCEHCVAERLLRAGEKGTVESGSA